MIHNGSPYLNEEWYRLPSTARIAQPSLIEMIHPSLLACLFFLGMASVVVQLRPSSETADDPSQLAHFLFKGMGAE
jgi:hypothetical protein